MTLLDYQLKPWYETELPYEHGACRVIADSVAPTGERATTFEMILWRPMLPENNTYKMTSRNAASSRAIPLRRKTGSPGVLDLIEQHPAGPLKWGAEKPGMQSGDELVNGSLSAAKVEWDLAREDAIRHAERMSSIGVHKSIINRLLEPFMWVRLVQTSTDWANMIAQRSNYKTDEAQAEIAVMADSVADLLDYHTPNPLSPGVWHLPYLLPEERDELTLDEARAVSAARCARTSYLTFERKICTDDDVRLFEKLRAAEPGHFSPMEHQATPLGRLDRPLGNLVGYRQFRHVIEDELAHESRQI